MSEISNCPFCGHEDVELDEIEPGRYAVTCPECECIGPFSELGLEHAAAVESAIYKFNRRFARADQKIEWMQSPAAAEYVKNH